MSQDIYTLPLWIILVLPFAKILFTSLSIGSGGSGGIFGPGMVIGGMVGAAFWRLGGGPFAGLARDARALRDRRDDGALRRHRPRAAGGDADGRGDDGQSLAPRARDGRRRPLLSRRRRRDDLHEPVALARGFARPSLSLLLPAPLVAAGRRCDDAPPARARAGCDRGAGRARADGRRAEWRAGRRAEWRAGGRDDAGGRRDDCPPGSARRRRFRPP